MDPNHIWYEGKLTCWQSQMNQECPSFSPNLLETMIILYTVNLNESDIID